MQDRYLEPPYPQSYNFNGNGPSPSAPPPFNLNAISQGKFADVPPELTQDVFSGHTEIVRQGMEEHEARVCLILDVSASMQNPNKFFEDDIKGNQVQLLINKALALAFLFDDNQQIEVFPFGDKAFPPVILNRDNFTNATDLIMQSIGSQFRTSTNYAEPVQAIRDYYFQDRGKRRQPQLCGEPPVFAIFITDGEPNAKKIEAENEFISASHQGIFFKFIALKGKQTDLAFTYLSNIDDHAVKDGADDQRDNLFYIDNSDLVVLNDPTELNMEKLINEYRPWLLDAYERKLLQHDPGVKNIDVRSEGRVTSTAAASHNSSALFHDNSQNRRAVDGRGHDDNHRKTNCTIL